MDSERFSIRVARAHHVTTKNFQEILEFCSSARIELLIARCATQDLEASQKMETQGFFITDTLVYYAFDLTKRVISDDHGTSKVRAYRPEDQMRVQEIAVAAFTGYCGHYHADPNLDNRDCDAAYVSWAEHSCAAKSELTEVLVAENDTQPVGFGTMRLNSPLEAEGVLFAVAPKSQKLGVLRSLVIDGIRWCKEKGVAQMIYSTQITNIPAQKVLVRAGFEPIRSHYTFHKWFTHAER